MQQARLVRVLVVLGAVVLVATAWRYHGGSGEPLRDAPLAPAALGAGATSLAGAGSAVVTEATLGATREALPGAPDAAPVTAPAASTPDAPPAIRGVVVDELGAPLAGATVTAEHDVWSGVENWTDGPSSAEAFATTPTSEDGRFELPLPMSTLATVRAALEGRAPTIVRGVVPEAELRLVLTPAATLEGDVLDAHDRTPIADALVRVMHGEDGDELMITRTNGVGRFRVEGLAAGTVAVIVAPETHMASRQREVDLASGALERIEILVAAGRVVTGVVRDAVTLDALEGARVSAWNFYGKTVATDGQGRFRIEGVRLLAGNIVADAVGYGRVEIELDAGSASEKPIELELALERAVRLTGRVVDARSAPIPGAVAVANGYQDVDGNNRREWREAVAGVDGRFVIEGARADMPLAVLVRAPGFGARSFDAPVPDEEGVVALGDLALASQVTLAGRVVDHLGEPVPDVYVGLQRAGAQLAEFDVMRRTAYADRAGRFFFAGLDEGVVAVGVSVSDGRAAGRDVTLRAGEQVRDLVIALPDGETLRGRVIDGTSKVGLADALVVLTRAGGTAYERRSAHSDEAGEFELVAVSAGEWVLEAHPPSRDDRAAVADYLTLRRPGFVADGTYLELLLTRLDAELQGRVLDAGGAPAAQRFVAQLIDGEPTKNSGVLTGADGRFTLRVPSGAPVVVAAYATATIRGNDSITVLDYHMGRRVLLADGPVARATAGVGAEEVTLRLGGE